MTDQHMRNISEAELGILKPQCAKKGLIFDDWITSISPKWQKEAVLQMDRYLSYETGYRHDSTSDYPTWKKTKNIVKSICDQILQKDGIERNCMIGFIRFHLDQDVPLLYKCYLHPFYRHNGIMEKEWTLIQKRYGKFEIEPPLTHSMIGFLKKVDRSCIVNYDIAERITKQGILNRR